MSTSKMRRRYKQCEIYLLDPGSLNVTSIMRPFGEFPVCGAEENPKKWKRILTRGSGHGLTTDPWLAMLLPQLTRLERLEIGRGHAPASVHVQNARKVQLCPETWKTKYRDLLSHHKDSLRELIFLPFNREFDPDMSDLSEDEYEGEEVYEDHPLHNEFIGSLSQFTVLKEIHLRTHNILESEDSDLSRDQRQLIHNLPTSLEKLDIDELTDIGPHESRRLIAQLEQLVSQAGQKSLRLKKIQIAGEFPDTPQDDDEPWPEDVALYTDGVWNEDLIDTQLVSDTKELCRICEEKNVLFTLCYPLLDPGLFEKIQIDLT
ncbi:hypothetical protein MW887_004542 [Aspergillus wentii]|nr:hypothetical protein MW887_004542 [Aspergillus wentii]